MLTHTNTVHTVYIYTEYTIKKSQKRERAKNHSIFNYNITGTNNNNDDGDDDLIFKKLNTNIIKRRH